MKHYVQLIVSMFIFLFAWIDALACSMSSDYVIPTNFELVELADAIVIAKPIKQTTFLGLGDNNVVTFSVASRIKGSPPDLIKSDRGKLGVFVQKSDPKNISYAHPESFLGPCSRYTFKRGNPYILFLKKEVDDSYSVGITAFSRDREDYAGPGSFWKRAIAYYLDVQKIEDRHKQLVELKNKYSELPTLGYGPYEQKLASDIAAHLSSTSPYKPSRFLIDSFEALDSGHILPFGIRHPGVNKEGSEADLLTDFIMGAERNDFAIQAQKEYILKSLAAEGHSEPETKLFFENLFEKDNSAVVLGYMLGYLGQNGYYEDALDLARNRIMSTIPTLKKENVQSLLSGIYNMNRNKSNWEHPKWMDHTEAQRWWPQFEYKVMNLLNARFGTEYTISKPALKALRPTNYRDNPEIAKRLAELYDETDVIVWAEKEIWDLIENGENVQSEKFALPMEIVLIDYYVPKPEIIDRIFCDARARPILLNHLKSTGDNYTDYLSERFAMQSSLMSPWERQIFLNALKVFSETEGEHFAYGEDTTLNHVYDEIIYLLNKDTKIEPVLRNRYFQYRPVKCE